VTAENPVVGSAGSTSGAAGAGDDESVESEEDLAEFNAWLRGLRDA
jgi:hypothetical protein